MEKPLKSAYGTVRPYTRHATGCTNQSDDNSCSCPKWLYVFSQKTKQKRRYTLNTPSWAEALREASDALRGLDPEIAASRAKTKAQSAPLTVREAMHLWVARTENKLGKDASTLVQYRHLKELVSEWARALGIKYVKRHYQPSAGNLVRVARMDPTRSYDQEATVGRPATDVCTHGKAEGDPRVPR